jgi:protein-tyrosine phosphatase
MKKILFVCLGNICRSPAAEAIADFLILRHGLTDRVFASSAGTANYQLGKAADPNMLAAAASRGYRIESQAKQLTPAMVRESDLVVAMDRENYRDVVNIAREEPRHLVMLSDFLDAEWPRDVPDPYRGSHEGFEFVLDMLEKACPQVLSRVLGEPLPHEPLPSVE